MAEALDVSMVREAELGRGARWLVAAGVAALLPVLQPLPAAAQMEGDSAFEDAGGFMWGTAGFEVGLLATTIVAAAVASDCDGDVCGAGVAYVAAVGIAASAALGLGLGIGVGAIAEVPPDIPFVAHHLLVGMGAGVALGTALGRVAGLEEDTALVLGLVTGGVLGLGLSTYLTLRRDDYVRDPALDAQAHMMTWLPMALAPLAVGILGETDREVTLLVVAGLVIAIYASTIAWAEVELGAAPAAGAPGPLGWSGRF